MKSLLLLLAMLVFACGTPAPIPVVEFDDGLKKTTIYKSGDTLKVALSTPAYLKNQVVRIEETFFSLDSALSWVRSKGYPAIPVKGFCSGTMRNGRRVHFRKESASSMGYSIWKDSTSYSASVWDVSHTFNRPNGKQFAAVCSTRADAEFFIHEVLKMYQPQTRGGVK